jgi:hypothetical protein
MGAKSWRSEPRVLRFGYDFDEDGGAIGTFALGDLPEDFVVESCDVAVETALTSGGTPVVEFGNDADQNGYIADIGAASAGLVEGAGALLTGKHLVLSSDDSVDMEVGTAALTAGKLSVYVRGYQAE